MSIRRKRNFFKGAGRIMMPAVIVLVLVFFLGAVSNLDEGRQEQALIQLEEALRRASAACYAAEGIYPPDLDYLEEHYGVIIDEERYIVHYEVQGSNLMPDITVLEKDW
ncbi:MAG: hypothetical protein IJB73_02645 [Firmicutes bacterium]|nr:hypothetical protein [Bacillota bacterium]